MSQPANEKSRQLERVIAEYKRRVQNGEHVDRATLIASLPHLSDELHSFFASADHAAQTVIGSQAGGRAPEGDDTLGPNEAVEPVTQRRTSAQRPIPERFGHFEILRLLGRGAMGVVYLARDSRLGRTVALKIPTAVAGENDEVLKRFFREGRAAAVLNHPNICSVHEVDQVDGTHYIAMQYIDGNPLSNDIAPDRPMDEHKAAHIVRKLARALSHAHEHGIIHRDLKPANVMIDQRREPILTDFGLARDVVNVESVRVTQSGMLLGTPAYMSPEQVECHVESVGPASDIYSLGVIFYELLTGQLPFEGPVGAILAQIVSKEPQRPSRLRPNLDRRLESICLKMMSKPIGKRFASMDEVASALTHVLKTPSERQETDDAAPIESSSQIESPGQTVVSIGDARALYRTARKCWDSHDFEQIVRLLEQVPRQFRDPQIDALLEKATQRNDEVNYLLAELESADAHHNYRDILPSIERLLQLKPGHRRALALHQSLTARGNRSKANPKSGRFAIPSLPFETKWVVAVGAIVCLLVLAAVLWPNLKSRRVAFPVAIDNSVKASGVQVRIDGKRIDVATLGTTIELEPGSHELEIIQGDRIRSRPFQVNRGENAVLSITLVDADEQTASKGEPLEQTGNTSGATVAAQSKPAEDVATRPKVAGDNIPATVPSNDKGKGGDNFAVEKVEKHPTRAKEPAGTPPALLVAPFDEAAARRARQEWAAAYKISGELTNSIGMKLNLIPPGEFLMGSPESEQDRTANELQHRVRIAKPFYMGVYEVTQAEYQRVMGDNPSCFSPSGRSSGDVHGLDTSSFPVDSVSSEDAMLFCDRLGQRDGARYRLPTEAEWEYACRAGTTTPFHFGSQMNGEQANVNGHFPYGTTKRGPNLERTTKVGSYASNAFGLFDMHGNISEWCSDWYDEKYYTSSPTDDPLGAEFGAKRVLRGGRWLISVEYNRAAYRDRSDPDEASHYVGFRVVRECRE